MQEKDEFFLFGEYILKEIFKDTVINKKNKKTEIIINNNSTILNSKFEFKIYLRDLISSNNNKQINEIIRKIIEIKYQLKDNKKIKILYEIYPNLDVFISAYLKLTKDYFIFDEIKNMKFNYDELLEYLILKNITILTKKKKILEKKYNELIKQEKTFYIECQNLENKLKLFQVIKKNTFYYDTYTNSLNYEAERFNQEKDSIIIETNNLETILFKLNKKLVLKKNQFNILFYLNKLTKNIFFNKKVVLYKEKINEFEKQIKTLSKEKNHLLKELAKLEKQNKHNINRNEEAFRKFLSPYNITMEEYLNNYEESINVDCKEILKKLNNNKTQLDKIKLDLKNDQYLKDTRILKYFCSDNLKDLKIDSEMDSNILDNIINILKNTE